MRLKRKQKTRDHVVASNHVHQWKRWGTRGYKFVEEDCKCGERREREATKAEARQIRANSKLMWAQGTALHALAHSVDKRFKKDAHEWKEKGWDLIEKLEKFAAKHPQIRMVRVDDSSFTNSELVLVPHTYDTPKLGCSYMGTTVIFVAQCAGDPPVEFFLYPNHLRNLIQTLQEVEKKQNTVNAKARRQGNRFP
jgi:hypothetical protein